MDVEDKVLSSAMAIAEAEGLRGRREDFLLAKITSSEQTSPRQTRLEPLRGVRWFGPMRCYLPGRSVPKVVDDDPPGGDLGDIQAAL